MERGGSFSKIAIELEPEAMAGVATATIEIIELSEIRKQKRAQGGLNPDNSYNNGLIRNELICRDKSRYKRRKSSQRTQKSSNYFDRNRRRDYQDFREKELLT